jgi:hypothetical protein
MILFQVYLLQTLVYRSKALDGLVLVSKVFGSCAPAKPTTWRLLGGAEPQLPCDRAVVNIWALGLKKLQISFDPSSAEAEQLAIEAYDSGRG